MPNLKTNMPNSAPLTPHFEHPMPQNGTHARPKSNPFWAIVSRETSKFALILLLITPNPALATQNFTTWLDEFRIEATKKGISEHTFNTAFAGVKPLKRVIELDRNQPEFTLTLEQYLDKAVSETRIKKARMLHTKHEKILTEISQKFKVQSRFIVALWGIETNFGQHTGGFSVITALATLAHDGRRSNYFRGELLNALTIIEQGHINAKNMKGSWAGAMGQNQFMPSSFLNYAYDYDGDGKRDIWTNQKDVFASIANYLASVGWRNDINWGREIRIPKTLNGTKFSETKTKKSMQNWQKLGIRRANGTNLPNRNLTSRIVIPRQSNQAFIVYENYENLLKWNRSNYFALAVGRLADKINTAE